jgi:epoxide hydrolase-like predicted phosphatase
MKKAENAYCPIYRLWKNNQRTCSGKVFSVKTLVQKNRLSKSRRFTGIQGTRSRSMPELVKKLGKNYRLAALTDCGKEWLEFKLKKSGLEKVFDPVISSCHSGVRKPDEKIYKILIERLNMEPSQCVFIDDNESNLLPARKLGIYTVLFQNQEQLEEEFGKLNIQIPE